MLRQPAADRRDAAVRWRQLVDLIARAGAGAEPDMLTDALAVIRADAGRIDEPLRAAAARAIAALPLPLGLLECFVADRLAVSAPILAAATLDTRQWRAVLAHADAETRRFIETLHPDLALAATSPASALGPPSDLSIGELVSRIERRRTERGGQPPTLASPQETAPAAANQLGLFLWETGPNGEIDWADGVPRGAVIGRSLARDGDSGGDRIAPDIIRSMAGRTPFADHELVIAGDGPVAGRWLVSGIPAFDPGDGRFCGYRGSARRKDAPVRPPKATSRAPQPAPDQESLRELVHELKTPLNAIIGFSEIIEGQFLGPAGRRYRDRALDIAGDARVLLEAIDDLDLAATRPAGDPIDAAAHLDAAVTQVIADLRTIADQRGVELAFAPPPAPIAVALDPRLQARLVRRLVGALLELAVSGERLRLAVEQRGGSARLVISRPVALAGSAPAAALGAGGDYSLRLARGLARVAGGELSLDGNAVVLEFASH